MIKTILLIALALSACTRYVPAPTTPTPAKAEAAPTPAPAAATVKPEAAPKATDLYHHAEDTFLKTTLGKGAACVRDRATPEADSATCTTAHGDIVVHVWDSAVAGFGTQVLVAPPPPAAKEKKTEQKKK